MNTNTLLPVRVCENCGTDEENNPATFSGAESNFVNDGGEPSLLCLTCWDEQEGLICSHCDRLAANYYTEDMVDANTWRVPWPNHYEAVCFDCALDMTA